VPGTSFPLQVSMRKCEGSRFTATLQRPCTGAQMALQQLRVLGFHTAPQTLLYRLAEITGVKSKPSSEFHCAKKG